MFQFSGKISFNNNDVINFLKRRYFFAGVHWKSDKGFYDNKFPEFYQKGVWINGYGRDKQIYNFCMDKVQQGDIILAKKLHTPNTDMQILAAGVVVGIPTFTNEEPSVFYVSWVLPKLDIIVPRTLFGTINSPRKLKKEDMAEEHYKTLSALLKKVQTKFLLNQLKEIEHTLYQV